MDSPTSTHRTNSQQRAELQVLPNDISPERKQAQHDYSAILKSLPVDPLGAFCLGKDGVMRSLSASREVLGAVPLSPRLIKADLDRRDYDQEVEEEFRGVDGTKTPRENWFHPPPGMLPPPLDEDQLREGQEMIRERGLSLDVKPGGQDTETGDALMCPLHVRSDYNITGE